MLTQVPIAILSYGYDTLLFDMLASFGFAHLNI